MAHVLFAEEVVLKGELASVRRDQLVTTVRRLARTPDAGKPLRGRLFGCRSVRVGGSENRLVYVHVAARDTVVILAIGRRRDNAVYETAASRVPPDSAL
jgi:mRNA-degrading endonuclease RelE of RelBE toxin-antitoxin system